MTTAESFRDLAATRDRGRRRPELLGDPFARTKLDHAFNLLAAGVLRPAKHDLERVELIKRLVRAGGAKRPPVGRPKRERATASLAKNLRALLDRASSTPRTPASPQARVAEDLASLARIIDLDEGDPSILRFALACRDRDMKELLHLDIDADTNHPGVGWQPRRLRGCHLRPAGLTN